MMNITNKNSVNWCITCCKRVIFLHARPYWDECVCRCCCKGKLVQMSGNHNLWRFWSKLGSCGVPLCTHNPTINITFFLWNCNSRILLRIPILRTSPIVAEECASTTCASGIILSIVLSSVTFYITCSSTFILKWAPNVNMDLCDLQIFWRVAHKNGQPGSEATNNGVQ